MLDVQPVVVPEKFCQRCSVVSRGMYGQGPTRAQDYYRPTLICSITFSHAKG